MEEKIVPLIMAGMIAVSPVLYTGCDVKNFGMTRQEHIRADCLERYRNNQVRSWSKCVEAGYAREKGR
ncbi:hypothetical protein HYT25_04890 [Candidatus Pacearchaeota archaeon]|nr:hypothetical protein [Candidatus Pacearchaeota archaeon]